MTERLQVHKCELCEIVAEVLAGGAGVLVCCGQPMQLLKENAVDAAREKHVPVIERVQGGMRIKVGSMPHPMEAQHFVQWVEVVADGKICRQFLQPGQAPEAMFKIEGKQVAAREYCNLHGLWKG